MSVGLLFWFLMIITLIFGAGVAWPRTGTPAGAAGWYPFGYSFLLWVLLALLGFGVFGFSLHK